VVEHIESGEPALQIRGGGIRRGVAIALAVFFFAGAGIVWLCESSAKEEQARQYLLSRGYTLYTEEMGWGWYQQLADEFPVLRIERVVGLENQDYLTFEWGPRLIDTARGPVQPLDADWEAIKRLTKLTAMSFDDVGMGINVKDIVESAPGLETLKLRRGVIDARELRRLSDLDELKHLTLNQMDLTDDDLRHLEGLQVERLEMILNKTTVAGLKHLETLPNLERLYMPIPLEDQGKVGGVLPDVKHESGLILVCSSGNVFDQAQWKAQ
jgi:hypothetical protein